MTAKRGVRTLKPVLVVAACALVAAIGLRVAQVNADAPKYPRTVHTVGEPVALKGAFSEYDFENTDGYTVTVDGARLMSRDEYLSLYAVNPGDYDASIDATDGDAKSLVVLDITIRNDKQEGDEKGYLDSLGWSVVPNTEKHRWMRVDTPLFDLSVPQLDGGFQLSVKPGTEYTLHVPFSTICNEPFPASGEKQYRPTSNPGTYQLILTNVPVRHVVSFKVS